VTTDYRIFTYSTITVRCT